MRLKRLEVTNFRSIRSAEVEFVRMNWVLGDNGEGKTSLLRAIGAALQAKSSKFVVNAEAKSSKVCLDVQGPTRAVDIALTRFRSKPATPSVNGFSMPRAEYAKAMPSLLGVTESVIGAVLASGKFMSSKPKDQASLILAAAGVTHEWADAEAYFKDWCEEQEITHFELVDVLAPVRLTGLDLIDAIYADAYGQRTLANKQAALEAHAAPEPAAEILQYVRNRGLEATLRNEAVALSDRLPRLQQQISWLAQLDDEADPEAELESIDQRKLKAMAAELRERRAAFNAATATVVAATTARDVAKTTHDSLDVARCPFGVRCDFKEWAPEQWGVIKADLESAEIALEAAVKAHAALPTVSESEIAVLRREKDRIDDLERKIAVRKSVRAKVTRSDPAALNLEVDQVAGRKSAVTALIDSLAGYRRAKAKHDRATRNRESAQALAGKLDTIVKGFERAIRYKMVDEVLARFTEPMAAALRLFVGDNFTFTATATGGFSLSVMRRGMMLPFVELSESEKLMVSTAGQHAIATLAGAEILVIDAVDTLRGDALQRFIRGLYVIAKGYRTVVVASTTGRISPKVSPLRSRKRFPDTQLMVIQDGVLEVLPQLSEDEMRALR
jgi:ABC-type cobalamin/Fe3+-siderophores transport system ATPase subunit